MLSKSVLVLSALSAASAAILSHEQLSTYTFPQYVKDFSLSVKEGTEDYKIREVSKHYVMSCVRVVFWFCCPSVLLLSTFQC